MKVNVTKANHHYKNKDGVMVKVEAGEQDLPDNVAKAMIASGKAQSLEVKEPSASDIVKIIKAAETLESIAEYAEDDRKTVIEAYSAKVLELTHDE